MSSLQGKLAVGIFWDIENCPIPKSVNVSQLIQSIRARFLRPHAQLPRARAQAAHASAPAQLDVDRDPYEVCFKCYCNIHRLPVSHQESLHHGHVTMCHVVTTKEGACDRALWLDLDKFTILHSPPAHIVLITGDSDFVQKVHLLRHTQGYQVSIVHNQVAKNELKQAATHCIQWQLLATGKQNDDDDDSNNNKNNNKNNKNKNSNHGDKNNNHAKLSLPSAVSIASGSRSGSNNSNNINITVTPTEATKAVGKKKINLTSDTSSSSSSSSSSSYAIGSHYEYPYHPHPLQCIGKYKVNNWLCDTCYQPLNIGEAALICTQPHCEFAIHLACGERKPLSQKQARQTLQNLQLQDHGSSSSSSSSSYDYNCLVCEDVFSSLSALEQHQKAKNHLIECPYCEKQFGSNNSRQQHIASKHQQAGQTRQTPQKDCSYSSSTDEYDYECLVCEDVFSSLSALEQHQKAKDHLIECPYCEKQFGSNNSRQQHIESKHQTAEVLLELGNKIAQLFKK